MNINETIANEAIDAMELVRLKVQDLVASISKNDYGDSGDILLGHIDGELSTKLVAAYTALEDMYGLVEDLQEAP